MKSLVIRLVALVVFVQLGLGCLAMEYDSFITPPSTPKKNGQSKSLTLSPTTKLFLDKHKVSPKTKSLLLKRASPQKKRLKPFKEQNVKVFSIKLEDESIRWVKMEKKKNLEMRIEKAKGLKSLIEQLGLKHIDVSIPELYRDENGQIYGIEKDCGKTLYEDASSLTVKQVTDLLILIEESGYRDVFPRNFTIKSGKLFFIDTDQKAFDQSVSIVGGLKNIISVIQKSDDKSFQVSPNTSRKRKRVDYSLLENGELDENFNKPTHILSDDKSAMIQELEKFILENSLNPKKRKKVEQEAGIKNNDLGAGQENSVDSASHETGDMIKNLVSATGNVSHSIADMIIDENNENSINITTSVVSKRLAFDGQN